jgi:cell division septation protein DedD
MNERNEENKVITSLKDMEKIREKIEIRLEPSHVIYFIVLILALIIGAFFLGYHFGAMFAQNSGGFIRRIESEAKAAMLTDKKTQQIHAKNMIEIDPEKMKISISAENTEAKRKATRGAVLQVRKEVKLPQVKISKDVLEPIALRMEQLTDGLYGYGSQKMSGISGFSLHFYVSFSEAAKNAFPTEEQVRAVRKSVSEFSAFTIRNFGHSITSSVYQIKKDVLKLTDGYKANREFFIAYAEELPVTIQPRYENHPVPAERRGFQSDIREIAKTEIKKNIQKSVIPEQKITESDSENSKLAENYFKSISKSLKRTESQARTVFSPPPKPVLKTDEPVKNAEIRKSTGTYSIQVRSYQEMEKAQEFMDNLKQMGYKPFVITFHDASGVIWHRIRIGHFNSYEKAKTFVNENLSKHGLESMIFPEDN